MLLLSLVAFPVAQFVLFPLVAGFSMRLGMLAVEGLLLAGTVLLIRRRGWVLEDLLLLNAVPRPVLLATPVAAVGAALLATGLDGRVAIGLEWLNLGAPASLQRSLLEIQLITDPLTAVLVPLSIVLVPAVCEEAFFRGYVLTGLRYHHGPVTAVVGSAVVFAAAHVNPWQFPALFALGLFLAALVHWTHSLYPAVIGHAVNNSLSVAAVNLRAYTGIDSLGAVDPLSAAGITAGAAALAVGVRSLLKSRPIMPLLAPHTRPAPADGLPGLA